MQELRRKLGQTAVSATGAETSVKRLKRAFDDLAKSANQVKVGRLTGGVNAKTAENLRQVATALGRVKENARGLQVDRINLGVTRTTVRNVEGLAGAIDILGRSSRRAEGPLRSVSRSINSLAFTGIAAEVRRMSRQLDAATSSQQRFNNAQQRAGRSGGRLLSNLVAIRTALFGLGSVAAIRSILDIERAFERAEQRLAFASGAERAVENLAFVRAEADRLGRAFLVSAENAARVFAAGRSVFDDDSGLQSLVTGVLEASAALNLTGQDTAGIFQALDQVISKGKVSAEELRRQMGDRLPGAFIIAADAIGVTTKELDEMLKKGELVSEAFLPLFATQLRLEFFESALDNADSVTARLGRLTTQFQDLQRSISQGLAPALLDVGEGLLSLASSPGVQQFAQSFVDIIASGVDVVRQLNEELAVLGFSLEDAFNPSTIAIAAEIFKQSSLPSLGPLEGIIDDERVDQVVEKLRELESGIGRIAQLQDQLSGGDGTLGGLLSVQNLERVRDRLAEVEASRRRALERDRASGLEGIGDAEKLLEIQEKLRLVEAAVTAEKERQASVVDDRSATRAGLLSIRELQLQKDITGESNKQVTAAEKRRQEKERELRIQREISQLLRESSAIRDIGTELGSLSGARFDQSTIPGTQADRVREELQKRQNEDQEEANRRLKEAYDEQVRQLEDATSDLENAFDRMVRSVSRSTDDLVDQVLGSGVFGAAGDQISGNRFVTEGISDSLTNFFTRNAQQQLEADLLRIENTGLQGEEFENAVAAASARFEAAGDKVSGNLGKAASAIQFAAQFFAADSIRATTGSEKRAQNEAKGSAIGGAIGSIFGPAGAAFGSLIGGFLGSSREPRGFDTSFVRGPETPFGLAGDTAAIPGTRLPDNIQKDLRELAKGINDSLNEVILSLGGFLEATSQVSLFFSENEEFIVTTADGIKRSFAEQSDAISFALAQILKDSVISGLDPIVEAGLQRNPAQSFEQLVADLQVLQEVADIGVDPLTLSIRELATEARSTQARIQELLFGTDQLGEAFSKVNAGLLTDLEDIRNEILGIEKSEQEQRLEDAQAFNAEIQRLIAEQRRLLDELIANFISQLQQTPRGGPGLGPGGVDRPRGIGSGLPGDPFANDPENPFGAINKGFTAVAETGGLVAVSMAATEEALEGTLLAGQSFEEILEAVRSGTLTLNPALVELIEQILNVRETIAGFDDLTISEEEIASAGGGGNGDRRRRIEAFEADVDGIIRSGLDPLIQSILDTRDRIAELTAESEKLGRDADRTAVAVATLNRQLEDTLNLRLDSFGGFATQFGDRLRALDAERQAIIAAFEEQFGADSAEAIAAAAEAQTRAAIAIAELVREFFDGVAELSEVGAPSSGSDVGDRFEDLERERERLEREARDLFTDVPGQAAAAMERIRREFEQGIANINQLVLDRVSAFDLTSSANNPVLAVFEEARQIEEDILESRLEGADKEIALAQVRESATVQANRESLGLLGQFSRFLGDSVEERRLAFEIERQSKLLELSIIEIQLRQILAQGFASEAIVGAFVLSGLSAAEILDDLQGAAGLANVIRSEFLEIVSDLPDVERDDPRRVGPDRTGGGGGTSSGSSPDLPIGLDPDILALIQAALALIPGIREALENAGFDLGDLGGGGGGVDIIQDFADELERALDRLRDFREGLAFGEFDLRPGDVQIREAEAELFRLANIAINGSGQEQIDAINSLQGASDDFLRLLSTFFGSSDPFSGGFDLVDLLLQAVENQDFDALPDAIFSIIQGIIDNVDNVGNDGGGGGNDFKEDARRSGGGLGDETYAAGVDRTVGATVQVVARMDRMLAQQERQHREMLRTWSVIGDDIRNQRQPSIRPFEPARQTRVNSFSARGFSAKDDRKAA